MTGPNHFSVALWPGKRNGEALIPNAPDRVRRLNIATDLKIR
jgi:hypothetical protein